MTMIGTKFDKAHLAYHCGIGRMFGEVLKEGLPEDSFENRVARAD
jgi:hypothetical protein